jgi:hypothetical protein
MCAILIGIKIACSIYKLTHIVDYLECNKLFVINKFSVNMVLHVFVTILMLCLETKFDGHGVKIY